MLMWRREDLSTAKVGTLNLQCEIHDQHPLQLYGRRHLCLQTLTSIPFLLKCLALVLQLEIADWHIKLTSIL